MGGTVWKVGAVLADGASSHHGVFRPPRTALRLGELLRSGLLLVSQRSLLGSYRMRDSARSIMYQLPTQWKYARF